MQTPAPQAAQWAQRWHLAFLSQPREDGLGEISVVLWLDSQLSVVRSCSKFGVHSTAAPMDPWDGLIQLFWLTHQIFMDLSLITLHKQGGNICKVRCVEVLCLLDHVDSEKSFYEPGARFVGCWGFRGISLLLKWPDRLCCGLFWS